MPKYQVNIEGTKYNVDAPDSDTAWAWANDTHSTSSKPVESQQKAPEESNLTQFARGISARGNQAIAALNPWADQQKIAAEQEWVKQHPVAQYGQLAADMAITAPAGGLATLPARALATGAIEAATQPGGIAERISNLGYGALGAGVGEKVGNIAGKIVQPFVPSKDKVVQALANKAQNMGVPLSAADVTGNKTLQYLSSALDVMPTSSAMQQAKRDEQRRAWEKAIFAKGNEFADRPTEEALGAMKQRVQGIYNDVSSRNELIVDPQFKADLADVKANLLSKIPTDQVSMVKSYLKDFDKAPEGAFISGETYQSLRSNLDKKAQSYKTKDPDTYRALSSIRAAADNAMSRNLSPEDAALWKQANNDWMVMKNIQGATEPTERFINPNTFARNLAKRDENAMMFGTGNQDMSDLAKVGKQFISDKTRDSGTAQRQLMINLLKGGSLGLGLEEAIRTGDIKDAAISAGVPLAVGMVAPGLVSKAMWNPNGYLAKGIADMSKEVLPNLTRQQLISNALRGYGSQLATGE